MLETYQPGDVARSTRYPESHYQMAGWVVALRTMGNLVHEVDYLNAPLPSKKEKQEFDIRIQRKHLFHLCVRMMRDQHEFIPLIEQSYESKDQDMFIITRQTGLFVNKRLERGHTVHPLVKRASTAMFSPGVTKDHAILERLDGEIKLVADFYATDKQQVERLQNAKCDSNPDTLAAVIPDIQTEAAFYVGYYERERQEGWS